MVSSIAPSKLSKKSISFLEKRMARLNKALVKQRGIDKRAKGRSNYSSKWKNLLFEQVNTVKALEKKYKGKR